MSKKDDFKTFVSNHPELMYEVRDKKHTWQDLFEVYDLYGNDEKLWKNYLSKSVKGTQVANTPNLGELANLVKNVNMDNVQKYIDTAQKAIGIVQELTKGSAAGATLESVGPKTPRPINKIFED